MGRCGTNWRARLRDRKIRGALTWFRSGWKVNYNEKRQRKGIVSTKYVATDVQSYWLGRFVFMLFLEDNEIET